MKIDARRAAKQRRIAASLAEIGFALPGSLTVRAYRCGKRNCRCRAERPKLHGPYAFWTRKIDGKTITRMLSDEELAEYQPMFDNARKLRELTSQLQELSLGLVEPANGKAKPRPRPGSDAKSRRAQRSAEAQ